MLRKLVDADSGETETPQECPDCSGCGGYDASSDVEEYDDWRECQTCEGSGQVPMDFDRQDTFVPERDALTPND